MWNGLKYIVSEDGQFMIFSNPIFHKSAGRALQAHVHEKIVGAGFISLGMGRVTCWGLSESLGGIESRKEIDAQIIADAMGLDVAN
jgi:hypothetical protein